jgi:hypothetical protein
MIFEVGHMFCWSCGHENPDTQKFCGECGKSLFKPEKVVREFPVNKAPRADVPEPPPQIFSKPPEPVKSAEPERPPVTTPAVSAAPPPELPGTMLAPPTPPPVNPLVEESRVVHEDPIAEAKAAPPVPPTLIRDRVPNRITGPSFLGLSDEPSRTDDSSYYLLDEEPEKSSSWSGYVLLAVLVIVSLLVIRNWQDVRAVAADYTQRLGLSDAPKKPAGPQRVTGDNDATQMTPDATQSEGKSTTPSEQTPAKSDSTKPVDTPQQTAKLEKPQTDEQPATESKDSTPADTESSKPTPAKAAAPSPAVDNSQLEEAQKYLQGRGVPEDCNRGLDLLRSAAKQPNAKARVQMAALYSSGHCVTADPVQAYTWFSRAQEVEPRNKLIERNLDMLWARMSDQERQKVLR